MISSGMEVKLRKMLIEHEGYKNYIYIDTMGKYTGGIGYNFSDRGIPDYFINEQFSKDINFFYNSLYEDYSWFRKLNEARQIALIDMCFMGIQKFKTFKRMISALEDGNYNLASFEMLSSKWAQQVKSRADALAKIMLTGEAQWE